MQEKTLGDIFTDIWRARVFVLSAAVIGAIAAGLFTALAVPYNRAYMVISPANPMNGAEISSLLANDNLFALRYLVERVGVANASDFLRFEMIYKGASLSKELLKDPKIEMGLSQDRAFKFSKAENDWSPEKLARYIEDRVHVEPVGATSMRRMVYLHPNPGFAKYFLAKIHAQADGLIRSTIHDEAADRIQYLQDTIAQTYNPEHRRALTTLMLEQERLKMMVSIDQAFAASVIEPPASSIKPAWPDPMLIFPMMMGAFALAGLILFYIMQNLRGGMWSSERETAGSSVGRVARGSEEKRVQAEEEGESFDEPAPWSKSQSAKGWFKSNDPYERPLTGKKTKEQPAPEKRPKAANED